MARKLLAILLAITMVVPMVLSQAFAADVTFTSSMYYDGDVGYGYSVINTYPTSAYQMTYNIVLDYIGGSDENHAQITWMCQDGMNYGVDFAEGVLWVGHVGTFPNVIKDSDVANYLATEDYDFQEGEHYQFDWFVSATGIKGYVNGEQVIEYTGEGLFTPGGYII